MTLALNLLLGLAQLAVLGWLLVRYPWPSYVRAYLWCQAAYIVPVYLAAAVCYGSPCYAVVYMFCTATVLGGAFAVAWSGLSGREHRARLVAIALILAVVFVEKAVVDLHRVRAPGDWIVLVEAGCLFWLWLVTGGVAIYTREFKLRAVLALTWFAQCAYDFSFVFYEARWLRLNTWLPAVILLCGYLALGLIAGTALRKELRLWMQSHSRG